MTQVQKIEPAALGDSVKTFEFTVNIPGPIAATYTQSNDVLNPFKILSISYNNTVSSGTDDTTFDIIKNGTTFTGDFHDLVTITGQVTKASATAPNLAENSFAAEDTFDIEITTLGSNVDFLTLTFHAELL